MELTRKKRVGGTEGVTAHESTHLDDEEARFKSDLSEDYHPSQPSVNDIDRFGSR